MQASTAELPALMRIELTGIQTDRAQMPVYRHSKNLLKPSSTATDHWAGDRIVLPQRAVIEIDLRVLANSPAKIRTGEPVIELRRCRVRGGETVVQ